MKATSSGAISMLVENLERAFRQRSWHGPNLRGSVRGLTPSDAGWRPAPGRHSIAEQVLHAAYWKYVVRRRLLGEKRGAFPLKGSNWFSVPDELDASQWADAVRLLDEQHELLLAAVRNVRAADLGTPIGGRGDVSTFVLIVGIAAHDVYHAGQINLLKRLQRE